jgi:HK97 family phage prohead protease
MKQEIRTSRAWVEAVPVEETRNADGKTGGLCVKGYAILWNTRSEVMGRWVETIDPKCLDHMGDLNYVDIRMQAEHEGKALARTGNGSLRLTKDMRGLAFEADLDSRRADARDLYYAIERGDITQMSFGFIVGEETVDHDSDPVQIHVTRIERLLEISAVTFPAYRETTVEAVPTSDEDDDEMLEDEDSVEDRSWEIEVMRKRMNFE